MGDWDWDLQAVVRGCSRGGGGGGVEAARDPFSSFPSSSMVMPEVDDGFGDFFFCFPNLLGTTAAEEEAENYSSVQELEQLYKPFFLPKSSPSPSPSPSPSSSHPPVQYPHQSPSSTSSAVSLLQTGDVVAARKQQQQRPVSAMARSKRRKNQQKKVVCHVPVDGLSSDMWAWRKYGQKPIKGSPYPRGYYRCSSSKGCLARKQVERSRTDPGVFVITYTAEHNHPMPTHRNSLAGSTRHKFPQSSPSCSTTTNNNNQVNSGGTGENLILSSTSSMSPTTPLTLSIDEELFLSVKKEGMEEEPEEEQQEDEDEGMLLVSDLEMLGEDDMLFFGLDDLHQPTFGDHFPTTATAGGS